MAGNIAISNANGKKITLQNPDTNNSDITIDTSKIATSTDLVLKAPLVSPAFTGTPTAPTPTAGDNSTNIATTAFVSTNGVPSGTILTFASSTAPTGFLKANGALISRTTYAKLFAAIGTTFGAGDGSTTFALPDLRGYFPRGWDDARGVDTSRVFGSTQADDNKSHNHGVTDPTHSHSVYDPSHAHGITYTTGVQSGSGKLDLGGSGAGSTSTSYSGTGISIYAAGTGISINSSGGTEARPKNIALLYCIKY